MRLAIERINLRKDYLIFVIIVSLLMAKVSKVACKLGELYLILYVN